ncbi:DUF3558 domain-containing protein [Actinomycetospora sp. TBRC 11914]|uniref:DUF3558 domain-containing protein n=1 Tax=Actinomycetospora sp. TBRC 11914 TaxID=2729387 RepID=UPI00145D39F9|nr:DUF3558 domain-containing protein [Actinomycetospora sp. TBRC 11914]NMO88668.1 DUF3558 domain-containing protein [Actinomycetospora sp. TBRC 11914]
MRLGRSYVGLAVLVLVVGGCSQTQTVVAPAPPPTTTSSRYGAPAVPRSLDVAAASASPCQALLSSNDRRELGVTGAGTEDEVLGARGCKWSVGDLQRFSISVYDNRDLLADTYRAHLDPIFVPTEIQGFPAVRQKTGRGELNICTVTTGVAERGALDVLWLGAGPPTPENDACEFAEQATALVIRKLPPQR